MKLGLFGLRNGKATPLEPGGKRRKVTRTKFPALELRPGVLVTIAGVTLIDSHTHLDRFARSGELTEVLARAKEAGVATMIAIGTEPDDWGVYRDLSAAHPGIVHYSVGLHPCSVDENWRQAVDTLSNWMDGDGSTPVAVGETGLDRFHLPQKDPDAAAKLFQWQEESFRAHLQIAAGWDLPVVVHSRGAAIECIQLIDDVGFDWSRVVFHCFADGPDAMAELNSRGGRGSFTGIVTYKNAQNVRDAALAQGLDRLMVETDAPYLAPVPHRGKGNEPAYVVHTATALAELFGVTLEQLAERATSNTREFFRI
jgi:TatD DNase family protein